MHKLRYISFRDGKREWCSRWKKEDNGNIYFQCLRGIYRYRAIRQDGDEMLLTSWIFEKQVQKSGKITWQQTDEVYGLCWD